MGSVYGGVGALRYAALKGWRCVAGHSCEAVCVIGCETRRSAGHAKGGGGERAGYDCPFHGKTVCARGEE